MPTKFASPRDLSGELRTLIASFDGTASRAEIADKLLGLAEKVSGERIAMVFPSDKAFEAYLKKHPGANPKRHSVRGNPPTKQDEPAPSKERAPVTDYEHEDVRDLAETFRDLDERKDRLPGLLNMKRLVEHYYKDPQQKKDWYNAIDKLIAEERRNPKPLGV